MFKKIYSLTIFSIIAISSFLSAEIEYKIQDIGTLQTKESQAIAINNQGQILGWYNVDAKKESKHFFVRDRNGNIQEVPKQEKGTAVAIDWRYLADDGKAYGVYDNGSVATLFVWDRDNDVIKLGNLPGKEISTINNAGQVLIKSVVDNENGKLICRPAVWQNGKITKLRGLGGDIGVESEESYGFDMNNKGEVVGQSLTFLSYKNELYKQVHAVKWTNGKPVDLHNKVPKSLKTHARAINDLGDVLVYVGETRTYLPRYLIGNDGRVTFFSYDINKLNNIGCVYNCDDDYAVHAIFTIQDRNAKNLFQSSSIMAEITSDYNSIWTEKLKLIEINDNNEMIVQGKTIYGEEHAMLLTPVNPQ